MNGSSPTQHVPAWKRIGLKLKYANETAQDHTRNQNSSITKETSPPKPSRFGQKTDLSRQSNLEGRPRDKSPSTHIDDRKNDSSSLRRPSPSFPRKRKRKRESESATGKFHISTSQAYNSPSPPGKRRKSVTFTQGTKTEDGSSAKDLFQASTELDKLYVATFGEAHPRAVTSPETQSSIKRANKAKKKQDHSLDHTMATTGMESGSRARKSKLPTYLAYLQQYRDDRQKWKFNKSHQNSVFKNIFNIYRIPPEYDDALSSYLLGLQGEGAKDRLREAAQRITHEDPSALNTSDSRMHAKTSEHAISEPGDSINGGDAVTESQRTEAELPPPLNEVQKRQLQRERAQIILNVIGPTSPKSSSPRARDADVQSGREAIKQSEPALLSDTADSKTNHSTQLNGLPRKDKRRRKQRTEGSSIESSSNSSSSSDSENYDGRNIATTGNRVGGLKATQDSNAAVTAVDRTSSPLDTTSEDSSNDEESSSDISDTSEDESSDSNVDDGAESDSDKGTL